MNDDARAAVSNNPQPTPTQNALHIEAVHRIILELQTELVMYGSLRCFVEELAKEKNSIFGELAAQMSIIYQKTDDKR